MTIFIAVAVGGAVGALMRYLISGWAYDLLGTGFPWGTLAVNLLGSFLIGFLWQLFDDTVVSPPTRSLLLTGGLGAFTTFSTYELETLNLLRDNEVNLALLNVVGSTLLGLLCVILGTAAARLLLSWWR